MNKPPAFQFYPDDFLGGTLHFSDAETGLYMRLLCVQWNTGSLPDDDVELASYGKGGTAIERIKMKFKKGRDGRLRNERMETERRKQVEYRAGQSLKGKLGGRPAKATEKPTLSSGLSQTKAEKSSPSPSPSPSPFSSLTPKSIAPPSSEHAAFVKGWVENFRAKWGIDYKVDGGKDCKAVKALLHKGILILDLLEIAKKSWEIDSWDCRQSRTIFGFESRFNQINVEVKHGRKNSGRNNEPIQPVAGSSPVGGF